MLRVLQNLALELELTRTHFLGHRPEDEIGSLLDSARYLVAPSLSYETAPLSVIESMAHGKPVLVSDAGSLPELVEGKDSGTVVARGDIAGLAECIRRYSADDELCRRQGEKALAISERLSSEVHLAELHKVYERSINNAA